MHYYNKTTDIMISKKYLSNPQTLYLKHVTLFLTHSYAIILEYNTNNVTEVCCVGFPDISANKHARIIKVVNDKCNAMWNVVIHKPYEILFLRDYIYIYICIYFEDNIIILWFYKWCSW